MFLFEMSIGGVRKTRRDLAGERHYMRSSSNNTQYLLTPTPHVSASHAATTTQHEGSRKWRRGPKKGPEC